MTLTIHNSFLPHTDPDASIAFYCDALGFEVRLDVGKGDIRWVTVGPANQPDTAVVLHPIAASHGLTDTEKTVLTELVAKGSFFGVILASTDLDATFASLKEKGAEIIQEPTDQPWGARDMAVRDPSGNLLRIQAI